MLEPGALAENWSEAVKLLPHGPNVQIPLHPRRRKVVDETLPDLTLAWPDLKLGELTDEPGIASGACRIFTARGKVDADLAAQLVRVVVDLLPSGAGVGKRSSSTPIST